MNKNFFNKNKRLIFIGLVYVLVVFFRYFLKNDLADYDFWKIFIFYFGSFFLLPLGSGYFFFHQKFKAYFPENSSFFRIKEFKKEGFVFLVWIGFFLLIMLKFDRWRDFPVSPWIFSRWDFLVLLDLTFLPIILFFQEFFYRGFVLKFLTERLEDGGAIVVQAILATLFEAVFLSRGWLIGVIIFFFYCFLGWVSLRKRSFFYSWILIFLTCLFFDGVVRHKIVF